MVRIRVSKRMSFKANSKHEYLTYHYKQTKMYTFVMPPRKLEE